MFSKDTITLTQEQLNGSLFDLEWPHLLEGQDIDKQSLKGKVLILTNTASKCGLTENHFKELEAIYQEYKPRGLEIVGFPCGQFMNQEHGDFCKIREHANKSNITFPLTEKIDVNGSKTHPVFQWLKAHCEAFISGKDKVSAIGWNFGKFLVNQEGKVLEYFGPRTSPFSMKPSIEKALNAQTAS